jgi:hypothetical protein
MRLVTVRIALQGSCPIHHCQSRRSRRSRRSRHRSPIRSVEDSCYASMARYITRVRVHFSPILFQFPLLFLLFGLPVLSRCVHSILNSPLRYDNSSPLFWTCGINTSTPVSRMPIKPYSGEFSTDPYYIWFAPHKYQTYHRGYPENIFWRQEHILYILVFIWIEFLSPMSKCKISTTQLCQYCGDVGMTNFWNPPQNP